MENKHQIDNEELSAKIERFAAYYRSNRVSIDFTGIITNKNIISILNTIKPIAIRELFIITNRTDTGMLRLATQLNIPRRNVINVDDDNDKLNKINLYRIDYHIDNDKEFLSMLGNKGIEIR